MLLLSLASSSLQASVELLNNSSVRQLQQATEYYSMLQFAILYYSIVMFQAWALGSVGLFCLGVEAGAKQPSQPRARSWPPPLRPYHCGGGLETPDA